MRVVVDTNVLVSALIRPAGRTGAILQQLRNNAFTLLYAHSSLRELLEVLTRPKIQLKYGVTDDDVETFLALILLRGEEVTITQRITVCRDPKDNIFLEIGVFGGADVIVSGDQDLLVLHSFEEIPILTPAAFLESTTD